MANYNIEMQYYNGSSYDKLYPQITPNNINGKLSASQLPNISNLNGTISTTQLPTIPVNKGGTGLTSTTGQRVVYTGTNSFKTLASPSADSVLFQGTSGDPRWYTLKKLINVLNNNGIPNMDYGSYTGTGHYGQNNRTGITVGFRPRLLIIVSDNGVGLIIFCDNTTSTYINDNSMYVNFNYDSTDVYAMANNTAIYWYSAENAAAQMNTNNTKYYYKVFGD